MAQNKNIPPPAQFIDPATGYLTRQANNFLNSITRSSNMAAAGEVSTPAGSGLDGGGQVSDGITLSIAPAGVTNAMLRDSQPFSVIGRYSSTVGSPADIVATADDRVLARMAGVLAFYPISAIPATVADGDYGDITVTLSGSVWTIDANVVSDAKFRQSVALSVVGRSGNTTGNVADIAGTASQFLGVNAAGNALAFQTLAGDATLSGPTLTLATVNANTGTWGSATQSAAITLDGKGRATAASNVTITPAASSITGGQALTRANDTNVTLTLGGTPATALLAASSITLGWTGTLAVSRGGLGVGTITGLMQGNGTSAVTAITDSSTTGQVLRVTGASTYAWGALSLSTAAAITGTLPVGNGGTGITAFGTGVATALGVNVGSAGAFVTFNGALGTPSSGTLTNCTGLPISTGVSGLGTNVATFLATPSSANLASAITDETGSGALVFGTSPTIATPTTTGLIDNQGGQIKFPATQNPSADANTLDDYEEGTFTPTLTFGGGSTAMTGTFSGCYTKIGRMVQVEITIVLTAKGSSTGIAIIGGIPFTAAATFNIPITIMVLNVVSLTVPQGRLGASSTSIVLYDFATSAIAAMSDTNFQNNTELNIQFSYSV